MDQKNTQYATLTYSLPEEREAFETAYNGHKFRFCLQELSEKFRVMSKYGEKEHYTIEEIIELFHEILNEEGVTLYG